MRSPAVPSHRKNQRGIALAYFGVAMLALIAFAVIGIDVGRLAFTASEVQSVADVAATAAALAKKEGSADPVAQARVAVQSNTVNGEAADIGSGEVIESLTPGLWDFDTKTFTELTWDDPTVNAAKAIGVKTVSNFVAAAIGSPESTVHRQAIAAIGGSCSGRPVMPIAVGDCFFDEFAEGDPSDPTRCSKLPDVRMSNDRVDNGCFTSLGPDPASASGTTSFLPTTCCKGGSCGGGETPPLVSIGDQINVINGTASSVFKIIADCFNDGMTEFDIPIVKCNKTDQTSPSCPDGETTCVKCNQSMEVTGFAHIVITEVQDTGSNQHISFGSICKTTPDGGNPGCKNSSSFSLAIVK